MRLSRQKCGLHGGNCGDPCVAHAAAATLEPDPNPSKHAPLGFGRLPGGANSTLPASQSPQRQNRAPNNDAAALIRHLRRRDAPQRPPRLTDDAHVPPEGAGWWLGALL